MRAPIGGAGVATGTAKPAQGTMSDNDKPGVVICGRNAGEYAGRFGIITSHHEEGDWTGTFAYSNEAARTLVPATGMGGDDDGCTSIGDNLYFCRMVAPYGSTASDYPLLAPMLDAVYYTSGDLVDPKEYGSSAAIMHNPIISGHSCAGGRSVLALSDTGISSSMSPAACAGQDPTSPSGRKGTFSCYNEGGYGQNAACCAYHCTGSSWADDPTHPCGAYLPACRVSASEQAACGNTQPSSALGWSPPCNGNEFFEYWDACPGTPNLGWYPNERSGSHCIALVGNTPFQGGSALFSGDNLFGLVDAELVDYVDTAYDDRFYSICVQPLDGGNLYDINAEVESRCGPACNRVTCETAGYNCGVFFDGCDYSSCGTCGNGLYCNDNVCGECIPQSCESLYANCGTLDDGCGGTINCGVPDGYPCDGPNTGSVCVGTTCVAP